MHPADYTPVCTTELGRAANLTDEFAKRNVKLCGFSCNDGDSHKGWIEDIKVATGGQVNLYVRVVQDEACCLYGITTHSYTHLHYCTHTQSTLL